MPITMPNRLIHDRLNITDDEHQRLHAHITGLFVEAAARAEVLQTEYRAAKPPSLDQELLYGFWSGRAGAYGSASRHMKFTWERGYHIDGFNRLVNLTMRAMQAQQADQLSGARYEFTPVKDILNSARAVGAGVARNEILAVLGVDPVEDILKFPGKHKRPDEEARVEHAALLERLWERGEITE